MCRLFGSRLLFLILVTWVPLLLAQSLPSPADSVTYDDEFGVRTQMDPQSSMSRSYLPVQDFRVSQLPNPQAMPAKAKRLSLQEAIALSLRNNPNVIIAELTRITDKFGLETSIHDTYNVQWQPLTLSGTLINGATPVWAAGTQAGVTAVSGTQVTIQHTDNLLGGMGVNTINLTQPLLQNYGAEYNRIIYQNAFDTEANAKLSFKSSVITAVVGVITAYRTLIQDYNNIEVSKQSYESQKAGVLQTELQVRVGKIAPSELIQQQENLETVHLQLVQQEQQLNNDYQAFLTALGFAPTAKFIIDRSLKVEEKKLPSLDECIKVGLKNNIAYQQALIQLRITKRALITAENARKWTLNVTSTVQMGSQRSAAGQPLIDKGTNPNLGISLSVPFDNVDLKSAVVSAKIAIENAELTLAQTKASLISQILNQWETVSNQYVQVIISERAVAMQKKALENAQIQLKYGKVSMFEVNGLVNDLLTGETGLISEQVGYLNSITTLYQTLGTTLEKWHIKLRY